MTTTQISSTVEVAGFRLLRPCGVQPRQPLFVFLPGMDGSGLLQQQQAEYLAEAFDVRCLQMPRDDRSSWDQMAQTVTKLVQQELAGNKRPVYLCGESFGGCLALKTLVRSPQLFDSLILINPASSFRHHAWMSWSAQITRWIPELLYPASCVGLLPFLASLDRLSTQSRQALLRAMNAVTQRSSIWRIALLQNFGIAEVEYQRITQPTLLIASRGDRLLPSLREADRLSQHIPHAKTHILRQSGHACLLENGVNLYEILQAYHVVPERQA
ncbi:MAG: alpha/beta fold hydrolase [Synechococcales cyanobacterium T60_A2020_003]|nr:alpha/beta fold hydrolase [Synechococcales cyanobacterium T60_A2020_003]